MSEIYRSVYLGADPATGRDVMRGWKLIDSETGEPRYFSTLGDVPDLCPKCGAYWRCDCDDEASR